MKRLLFFIALLSIACTTAFSQISPDSIRAMRDKMVLNTDKFLTVKGVELKPGLKMYDCLNKFLSKGLKKSELYDYAYKTYGIYNLEGSFFGTSNCKITIHPLHKKNIVSGIDIEIHRTTSTSFKQLKTEYDNLKSALSQKYYIFESKEGFDDDYINKTTSDYLKLSALEHDEGTFKTTFCLSDDPFSFLLGQVSLCIEHLTVDFETYYCVSLTYYTSDSFIEQFSSMNDDL